MTADCSIMSAESHLHSLHNERVSEKGKFLPSTSLDLMNLKLDQSFGFSNLNARKKTVGDES